MDHVLNLVVVGLNLLEGTKHSKKMLMELVLVRIPNPDLVIPILVAVKVSSLVKITTSVLEDLINVMVNMTVVTNQMKNIVLVQMQVILGD